MDSIMVNSEATNRTDVPCNSISVTGIASEISEYPVTYPEYEIYTESEVKPVARASLGEIEYVQESWYEGETKVDKVSVKFIKRIKYYNISFQVGDFVSYEEIV